VDEALQGFGPKSIPSLDESPWEWDKFFDRNLFGGEGEES
jgi:hypothetical protein